MKLVPLELIKAAQNSYREFKVLPSISLAQGILESAWFTKCSGKYNFFGIKAKSGTITWTHEYIDGKFTAVQQVFANYNCPQDAFDAHAELLSDPEGHYVKALPFLGQLESFVKAIAPIYATDPNYAVNLLNLIHVDNLQKYDIES